jgi:hypothetical protein
MTVEFTQVAERIELNGVFAQMLGVWYPKDYLVAALDAAPAEAAVEDLLAAGFGANAIHLHDSARVLRNTATIHQQRSALQRAGAALTGAVTDEGLMSQEYLDEATSGASLLAVRASELPLAEVAHRILAARGARRMRFYGDRSIIALP